MSTVIVEVVGVVLCLVCFVPIVREELAGRGILFRRGEDEQ